MFLGISYPIFWLVIAVLAGIVEAVTLGLFFIWFAVGAVAAWLSALFNVPFAYQIIIFLVISTVLAVITRPLAKKYVNSSITPTNADRLIGKEGIVVENIDTILGTGQVKVMGQIWSAKTIDNLPLTVGQRVIVKDITGVKLIVEKII